MNSEQKEALDTLTKMNVGYTVNNLHFYINNGDLQKVELLLTAGISANQNKNEKGEIINLLEEAIKKGNAEIVSALIKHGADVNKKNSGGDTPLIVAINRGNEEMVRLLIKNGADANTVGWSKANPLYLAEKKGNQQIIESLKSAGARPMTEAEIKAHKKTKVRFVVILVALVALVAGIYKFTSGGSASYSSSSGSGTAASHKCTWCNKSYSGNGYMHIGSRCEEASNGWEKYDNKCSMQCCEEAWKNNKH
jgi:hypothetical protein